MRNDERERVPKDFGDAVQRPDKPDSDLEDGRWRYSLMNWGHDPLGT